MLDPFCLQRVSKLYRKNKPVRITQQDEHLVQYGTQKLPKTYTFININTKQKQLFFLLQSMKKQLWHAAIQIFPYWKYIKTATHGDFCEELHRENDFVDVLVNFCCFEYGASISKAVQKISTRTLLELCQLTKTATVIATPMKKHIYHFITCLLEIQASFLLFFLTNKTE